MLPKENRLKKRSAFTATYKTGKSFHCDGVTVFCGREKKNDSPTKVGFVVSKKVHKRAVKRNRIRRLMRESFRLVLKEGFESRYMSLVFTASSRLLDKDFVQVNHTIRELVSRL